MSPELAELCGVHAGDGYLRNEGFRVELDISGAVDEKEYYDVHLASLFKTIFQVTVSPQLFPSRGTYGFVIRDKLVVTTFQSLGFPSGAKTTIVRVPLQIMESKDSLLLCAFLRGLFDTDGTLHFRKYYGAGYASFKVSHHTYPLLSFVTVSPLFAQDICFLLRQLGFTFNQYRYTPQQSSAHITYRITLNGVRNLERWMQLIGIGNGSKSSRYLLWKKQGYCPSRLTFAQRQALLNDKSEPLSIRPIV